MTKFSFEIVQMHLPEIGSTTIARRLGIKKVDSVLMWLARYRKFGVLGLEIRQSKYDYDGEFKLQVLNWRKQHQASSTATAQHFDISNGTIVSWQKRLKQCGKEALFTRIGRAKHMITNHNRQANK